MTLLSAEHGTLMSELGQLISEERNPNTIFGNAQITSHSSSLE